MMNENILKLLKNKEDFYPHQLAEKFPHLFISIFEHWTSPEFDSHLNSLMLDKRDHFRQGFPPAIASEILRLSMLHSELFGTPSTNTWTEPSKLSID